MLWLELSFQTTHEASDLLAEYLRSLGAEGVQVVDPMEIRAVLDDPNSLAYADEGFIDSLTESVAIKAYFPRLDAGIRFCPVIDWLHDVKGEIRYGTPEELESLILRQLELFRQHLDIGTGYLSRQLIAEKDWAENWKQYYQTIHLTPRLVINPSWVPYESRPDELVITMDPGSAFGTGTHESTAMCARILDNLVRPGDHVLDLGTGSGILAIIAARLGAASVEAIDIDPLAVAIARQNVAANQVTVTTHVGELRDALKPPYRLIVANIIAEVIIDLLPQLPLYLVPDGILVVSGIIKNKADDVRKTASAYFTVSDTWEQNDWVALVLRPVKTTPVP